MAIDDLGAPEVDRLWAGVSARAARRSARRRRTTTMVVVLAAAALVLLVVGPLRRRAMPAPEPLALVGGATPTQLAADPAQPSTDVRFADGSDVVMQPGAVVEVLENSGDRFITALRKGACTFDVHPGGPRRWVIESGHVLVEVVGTKFTVERAAGEVRVTVEHGIVVVRGERVPDGVQRLTAGAMLVVPEVETAAAAPAPTTAMPTPATTTAPVPTPMPGPTVGPTVVASTASIASATDEIGTLLHQAEVDQSRGDIEGAIVSLRKVVAVGGSDTRSAVAAFTLARLLLPKNPAEAARVLESAIARGMPNALQEDARARLVEAYARSGNSAAAKAAAADYLARYPNGTHRDEVARWLESP